MSSIYTVGHSNHQIEYFLDLLAKHDIEVLVDTRSVPRSSYSPQFSRQPLTARLSKCGVVYLFLGDSLGGMPVSEEYYDAKGRALYSKIAESEEFISSITRLKKGIMVNRIALLCSEEDPANCHRRLLVGRVLFDAGIELLHIRGDGSIQTESAIRSDTVKTTSQLELIPHQSEDEWTSTQSVLLRRARRTSSR